MNKHSKYSMQLIININHIDDELTCNSYLGNHKYELTNVHQITGSSIYKFRYPEKGAEGDRFALAYNGNIEMYDHDGVANRDIAVCILQSKEDAYYLTSEDNLRLFFEIEK